MKYPDLITCKVCRENKPFSGFFVNYRNGNIKDYTCRDCYSSKYKDKEKQREYFKRKRRENPEKKRKESVEYRNKYPERYRANYILYNAVKFGKVKKLPCEVCGYKKSHGHHTDYSKPLDVMWLCPVHHKLEHKKINAKNTQ